MENTVIAAKLDGVGRVTIPFELRKFLNVGDLGEVEFINDGNNIVIRKHSDKDIFGNLCNDVYFNYHGLKVSKKSIIELAKLAGIL